MIRSATDRDRPGTLSTVTTIKKSEMKGNVKNITLIAHVEALENLHHPNILAVSQVFETNSVFHVVMQAAVGQGLHMLLRRGRLSEPLARDVVKQMVSALAHCHDSGIAHHALGATSVLLGGDLKTPYVRLAGLGATLIQDVDAGETPLLTGSEYMPPELLKKDDRKTDVEVGLPADMWAVGVLTLRMLTGLSFGQDGEKHGDFRMVVNASEIEEVWIGVSGEARRFVKMLLCSDPNRRMTAAGAKCHTWLSEAWVSLPRMGRRNTLGSGKDGPMCGLDVSDALKFARKMTSEAARSRCSKAESGEDWMGFGDDSGKVAGSSGRIGRIMQRKSEPSSESPKCIISVATEIGRRAGFDEDRTSAMCKDFRMM